MKKKRHRLYIDFATRGDLVQAVRHMREWGSLDDDAKLYLADGLDDQTPHVAYVLSKDKRIGGEVTS